MSVLQPEIAALKQTPYHTSIHRFYFS